MGFVDEDEAKIMEGRKKGRTGADDYARFSRGGDNF